MRGDTLIAGAEDSMNAVEAGKSCAARTGTALVAGFCHVIKIVTARSLQQVAAGGGLVAQLRARARKQGAAQDGIVLPHAGIGCEVAVSNQRADPQAAIRCLLDFVER